MDNEVGLPVAYWNLHVSLVSFDVCPLTELIADPFHLSQNIYIS
jgi:hypothetical protein